VDLAGVSGTLYETHLLPHTGRIFEKYGIDLAGYMWARGVLWSRMAMLNDPETGARIGVLAKWFDYFNHDKVYPNLFSKSIIDAENVHGANG
jgi:hypothetical protein